MGASGAALQPQVREAVSPAAASTIPLWAGVAVLALGAPAYPGSTSVPGTSQPLLPLCFQLECFVSVL